MQDKVFIDTNIIIYSYSEDEQFYDALIIATALENRCAIVYSEDMQDGLIVDEKIKIINPFNV
ncbi:MAG: hypothetical protein ACOCP1_02230 [Campylobacterales bacterium]